MKGVVFNLLEGFIVEGWGDEAYEDILSMCPLKTKEPFVGPGTYPDADLFAIAGAAAKKLGVPLDDALVAFGRYCFPHLAGKFPTFVEKHTSAKSFLMSVDSVIHVEVRKLYPQAVTPSFAYDEPGPNELGVRYMSERKLCRFMEGLLDGLGDHFNERIQREQTCCMHQGAPHCHFALTFSAAKEDAA